MPTTNISGFVVNGIANGTVSLPCDGITTIPIVLSLNIKIFRSDPTTVSVPVWIGERGIFTWSTLIADSFTVTGRPGWHFTTKTYNLMCSNTCKLTPSGPATGTYVVQGDELELRAAFYDPDVFLSPASWWYAQNSVTVKCASRITSVRTQQAKSGVGSRDKAADQYRALVSKQKKGDKLIVTNDLSLKLKRAPKSRK